MRIGIDLLAVESPSTRQRGVGRLGNNLLRALLTYGQEHEYILYSHGELRRAPLPDTYSTRRITLRLDPSRGDSSHYDLVDRLTRTNPDDLDVFLLLSPFSSYGGYGPPDRPKEGLRLAAYVHDLIPFLFQESYLRDPVDAAMQYRQLERLRRYDILLTNSESTRSDIRRILGLGHRQVVNVSCDTDAELFSPDLVPPSSYVSDQLLANLGVQGPFVFNVGCVDEENDRKNASGLINAFHQLPVTMRTTHQLVIAGEFNDSYVRRLHALAAELAVGGQLVVTGEVSDTELRALYCRCAAFAFPSLYEGFGLPILEALRCGAAVVAGNNSSQPEVLGDAGLLANAYDPADIATKLARILGDKAYAAELGLRARAHSRLFSWQRTAERIIASLADSPGWSPPAKRSRTARVARPRIAVFSPFPPKASGIADYAKSLIGELAADFRVDLYHDPGYLPEPGLGSPDFACHDHRLFDRFAKEANYRALVYQMGNSFYHKYIYESILKRPGIVTLHDFCLAGFQYWYNNLHGMPRDAFRDELENFDPARADDVFRKLPEWGAAPGGVHSAFLREGLYLNRRVFERSEAVVVHSGWCRGEVKRLFPEHLDKTTVIPLGTVRAESATPSRRESFRRRFELPTDALILGSFGILSPDKMNAETIEAFAAIANEYPASILVFVGQDWGHGEARRKAEDLGLGRRVRFFGRASASDYRELTEAIDVGIGLRRPPTHGETSAALLDLLRVGVPTIVTDVATFSAYPDQVVRKVRWQEEGLNGLVRALRELVSDPVRRAEQSLAAWSYVSEHHAWPRAASLYVELIDQVHRTRSSRRVRAHASHGMHVTTRNGSSHSASDASASRGLIR